jgi:hypothetical protein
VGVVGAGGVLFSFSESRMTQFGVIKDSPCSVSLGLGGIPPRPVTVKLPPWLAALGVQR